jgi:hypothetical protein
VDLDERDVTFRREPDFGRSVVMRGAIPVGLNGTSVVAFAIDMTGRKLYLDRNGNMDLTDEVPVPADSGGGYSSSLTFDDVAIGVPAAATTCVYHVDVTAHNYGTFRDCSVDVESGWQGEVELAGAKWVVVVVDNMDGTIDERDVFALATADADRASSVVRSEGARVRGTRNLCVNGHSYDLSFTFGADAGGGLSVAAVPSERVPTGVLAVEGVNIRRLLLSGDRQVVLDRPGSQVTVPAGEYSKVTAFVAADKDPYARYRAELRRLRVPAGDAPVVLRAGGPLSNTVTVARSGPMLRLRYEVKGAEGRKYESLQNVGERNPMYVVRCSGEEVARGNFEYG